MAIASSSPKLLLSPNQTLYVSNLPDKLQKQDLRRELYLLFSTYGSVLDVVALKTMKMRGQAHIVYKDIQTAAQAMRHLENFEFFGKQLKIEYAKSKSNFVAKLDGTYKMPANHEINEGISDQIAAGDKGTALQQSVFGNAPGSTTAKPPGTGQNLKRHRDDEEESEDAQMEEDEEDMEMDESDEE